MEENGNAIDRSASDRERVQREQRRQMIEKLTDARVSIKGENMHGPDLLTSSAAIDPVGTRVQAWRAYRN